MRFLIFCLLVFVVLPSLFVVGAPALIRDDEPAMTTAPLPPQGGSEANTADRKRFQAATQEPTTTPSITPSPAATPSPALDASLGLIPPGREVMLGVYDPSGSFDNSPYIAIDHFFVSWTPGFLQKEELLEQLETSRERGRTPLVTIEPFASAGTSEGELLFDIAAGRYDTHIRWVCQAFGEFESPVIARWGHEMEYTTGRYEWATDDPTAFIPAYRHFVDMCREIAGNVEYMWAPAGNKNVLPYWPGDAYADYIGITIYGLRDWFTDIYGWELTFEEAVAEKYWRVAPFDKPVIIAELGIAGSREYQREWLGEGFQKLDEFPLLKGMVYFNDVDPISWGPEYSQPDWRLNPSFLAPLPPAIQPDPTATLPAPSMVD